MTSDTPEATEAADSPTTPDGAGLDPKVAAMAKAPNFAMITTLLPGGQPATQPVWLDNDGHRLLVNTERGRRKVKNIEADPRVTVTIWQHDNPYSYVEVRGRVVNVRGGDEARQNIDDISVAYTGQPYDASMIKTERIILEIEPNR